MAQIYKSEIFYKGKDINITKQEPCSQGFGAALQDGDLESNAKEVWGQQQETRLYSRESKYR